MTDTLRGSFTRTLSVGVSRNCKSTFTFDSNGFCTVVDYAFLEPRVLESFFGGNPFVGVINKDLLQKIEKELIESTCAGMARNDIL